VETRNASDKVHNCNTGNMKRRVRRKP
jgi:hypothetical protein